MFRRRRTNDSAGVVLLPVLATILVISVLVTGLLAAAKVMVQTETRREQSEQAYWLAHGAAVDVLQAFMASQPVSASYTKAYPVGWVETRVRYGHVWQAFVTAHTSSAVSVVRFDYDTSTRRVVDWQEHVPAS